MNLKKYFGVLILSLALLSNFSYSQDDTCDISFDEMLEKGVEHELSPTEISNAIENGYSGNLASFAASSERKALRWKEYLKRKEEEGKEPWDPDRWSDNYDLNQERWSRADEIVRDYKTQLEGLGLEGADLEVPVTTPFEFDRRLDIGNIEERWGIEVKSGYASHNLHIRQQIAADSYLMNRANSPWNIRWYFDGSATAPLLDALDEAGISYTFRDPLDDPRL